MHRYWQFHENAVVVGFAGTPKGKVLLWVLACVLIPWDKVLWIAPFLAVYLVRPQWRAHIMSLGSLILLYAMLDAKAQKAFFYGGYVSSEVITNILIVGLVLGLFVGIFYFFYRLIDHFDRLPSFIKKRPQVTLHFFIWLAFISSWIISSGPLEPRSRLKLVFWLILAFLPYITWRLGYLLMAAKRGRAKQTKFVDHLFYLWPVYGGTHTPFGKGHDYLAQVAAKNDASSAKSHLAGLRLLILANIWLAVRMGVMTLGLPQVTDAMRSYSAGGISIGEGWLALSLELVNDALYWAFFGHSVIGVLRLFGFYAFRNMYKPFLSQTFLEAESSRHICERAQAVAFI